MWKLTQAVGCVVYALHILSCEAVPTQPKSLSEDRSPSWSPTGDSIAFVHLALDPSDTRPTGIYIVSPITGNMRLVCPRRAVTLDWSPDGQSLGFDQSGSLFRYDFTDDSVTLLYDGPAYSPSWSPDGKRIAFDDMHDLYLLPAGGGEPTKIPVEFPGARDPDWSPDGKLLVALRRPYQIGEELLLVALDGYVMRRLTDDTLEERCPAWSPDGLLIAWNHWPRDSKGKVHPEFVIADTTGGQRRRLLYGEGSVDWAPSGRELVVSRGATGAKLYLMNRDGTGLRQLTF